MATFCVHCPGQARHKMSCVAFKGGYVSSSQPCTERTLSRLTPVHAGRLTLAGAHAYPSPPVPAPHDLE